MGYCGRSSDRWFGGSIVQWAILVDDERKQAAVAALLLQREIVLGLDRIGVRPIVNVAAKGLAAH